MVIGVKIIVPFGGGVAGDLELLGIFNFLVKLYI